MPTTSNTAVLPLWTLVPFGVYLLLIAVMPLFFGHFWERNRNKLIVAGLVSLPVVAFLLGVHPGGMHLILHSLREYLGFMALLTALFVISGGIYLRGSLAGTPLVNTGVLALGALLGNVIGTTGASVLLIRPLLRANATRQRVHHIVIFFIFVVSNGGGMLTPLGDPPLFLGFLRGVPFSWTFRLLPVWAMANGALLVLFNVIDQLVLNKEERERPGSQLEEVQEVKEPLQIEGRVNVIWLAGILTVVAAMGAFAPRLLPDANAQGLVQILALAALTALSLRTTPPAIHKANQFSWAPIAEVAVTFIGIFLTMIPALGYLEANGSALGLTRPWHFFWAAGGLSSFLDNAPTYLTFSSLAVGVVNQATGAGLLADNLGPLAAHPVGAKLLAAVSCGAVLMGAMTYIGNGPNFMVKAIAEQNRVRMPGFFGYMLWSTAILLPIFAIITFVVF